MKKLSIMALVALCIASGVTNAGCPCAARGNGDKPHWKQGMMPQEEHQRGLIIDEGYDDDAGDMDDGMADEEIMEIDYDDGE